LSLIFEKITASYHQSLPFVCFKKPKASKLKAYFGENTVLSYSTSFKEEGFIFAPFHNEKTSIVFLKSTFQIVEEPFLKNRVIFPEQKFDAHKNDPLAQFQLDSKDFYEITKRTLELSKLYCDGKVVSILEGGYDLSALKESTAMHVKALLEFN